MNKIYFPILSLLILLNGNVGAQTVTPEVYSWLLNNGEIGSYYTTGNFTPVSNGVSANCQQIRYSTNNVYVNCSGMPAYPIGPYQDGNPSQAGDKAYLFRIPRNPVPETGTLTPTRLGHVGVLINGVPIYNASDAMSYNNQGIWFRDAVFFENNGFDCAKGHPAPDMQATLNDGYYHHHQNPIPFSYSANPASNVCSQYPSSSLYTPDSTQHSPLIGFAFDGYPVYGSYGYSDPNDVNSAIKRMEPGWQKRNITQRTTLPDGTVLNPAQYGPAVNGTYPLGSFIEDYEFNGGDLDEHNGRFCNTPEYPNGIYCYFATIDATLNSAYPYFIGPEYYGEVAADNLPTMGPGGGSTSVVVNEPTTTWTGTVGITESQLLDRSLRVYPNPAQGSVSIAFSAAFGSANVMVVNTLGQTVIATRKITSGQTTLDISHLETGIYFVRVEKNGEWLNRKIVVQ